MKVVSISKLYQTDYNIKYLHSLKQFWTDEKTFSCINQPKRQSILLYLNGCKAKYVTAEGKEIIAKSNDVVYTPQGSEYTVTFFDFENSNSHTVGVNFFLYDENNKSVLLSDKIKVFRGNATIASLFYQIENLSGNKNIQPTEYKIFLFQLLNQLIAERNNKKFPSIIQKGVEYLNSHYIETPCVKELAKICFISEVYFRRLFKKEFNMTPVEYRNNLRLNRAKQYLEYSELSVQEISLLLGYSTVSHFIKCFKNEYGTSPLIYRNKSSNCDKTSRFFNPIKKVEILDKMGG